MANGQTAAQTDEDSVSSILGGSDDQGGSPEATGPTPAQTSPQATPSATAARPTPQPAPKPAIQVDSSQKVHPHVAILAGLVNKILSGIQNAPGNPNNPLDRGFMNASPRNQALQQAQVSKAMSEADQAKLQTSITGMKALQLEYMIKRLPQDLQNEHLKAISDFKTNLIKEGASIEAEGDDEKASDTQAFHLNGTDPRATGHAGRFYSLPTMDADGKAKFDVVYVPNKDTLQNDFKWTDANGDDQTIPAGTPISSALARFVEAQNKGAQNQTKEQHKQFADALGPATAEKAEGNADFLEGEQKRNTPIYQQNKAAVDSRIPELRAQAKTARQEKLEQAKATATQVTIPTAAAEATAREAAKHDYDTVYARDDAGILVATNRKTAVDKGYTQIDDTVSKADVSTDRKTAPIIKDVRSKIQDYQLEIGKGDLSAMEATELRGIMAMTDEQFEAKLEIFGFGAGVKPATRQLQEMFRGYDINNLSEKAQNRLATYIAARSSALELQKAQTQSSRASKEGLTLDLAQIPNPGIDSRMANKQLKLLQDSIARISENNPFVPK